MIRYLAESKHYKVYSIYENVYLKNKLDSKSVNEYDDKDLFIAWHYGDPCDAIILLNEKIVVVSGCGLTIYYLESGIEKHILDVPEHIWWTNGLHQDNQDDQNKEVRFVSWNAENQLRVFKIDLVSTDITELE